MMPAWPYACTARFLALAAALCLSACAGQTQKPAAATTTIPVSLSAHDNVVVTAGTPLPSLPPLTPAQRAVLKWQQRGWNEIASTSDRVYVQGQAGLQALRATNGSVVWRNVRCKPVGATISIIGDELFTACTSNFLSILSAGTGRILQTAPVPMDGINSVTIAGKSWLAVQGWNDGAALIR